MGPGPQASHQKGASHQTRRGAPTKNRKFLLRFTFAAKARRAKESKENGDRRMKKSSGEGKNFR
jgi:hypothetical protein